MESASRGTTLSRKYLSGLAKCIEGNMGTLPSQWCLKDWRKAKKEGERLFKPGHGGSYEVFNQRPIAEDIVLYCIRDVQCLPALRKKLWDIVTGVRNIQQWRDLLKGETQRRLASTHAPNYQPYGRIRALAPWTASQNKALIQCTAVQNSQRGPFANFDEYDKEDDNYMEDYLNDPV
jgi:exonuclease 3'-5' domain-containing protein 1